MTGRRVLYIIGAAAPPVRQLDEACRIAIGLDWDPCVILTPTAADWVDVEGLAAITGRPVRVNPRRPEEADPFPPADAVLAAPLTFNTINKWAAGISDTLALGLLNELLVEGSPIVAVPCVKESLRRHPAYPASGSVLKQAGARFMEAPTAKAGDGLVAFEWGQVLSHLR